MADTELNAHRIAFIVDHREERLLLPVERVEMAQAAVARIVLKRVIMEWLLAKLAAARYGWKLAS